MPQLFIVCAEKPFPGKYHNRTQQLFQDADYFFIFFIQMPDSPIDNIFIMIYNNIALTQKQEKNKEFS